jgi:hypothetical protein
MNSDTDAGRAHAELLLVTHFGKDNPSGNKNSSLQCIFCKVLCSLQYPKTMPKSVLCWGEGGEGAIEHIPGSPKWFQDTSLHHPFGGFL